jgi:hypothetical protein
MVYTAVLSEVDRRNEDPDRPRNFHIQRDFDDMALAQKFVVDYLVHIIEEGLRENKVDLKDTEFEPLFYGEVGTYRVRDKFKGDVMRISLMYNALFVAGWHNRIVAWEVQTDDPTEATVE